MRFAPLCGLIALPLLAACARIDNAPVNVAVDAAPGSARALPAGPPPVPRPSLIAVTLSGGGTRAAAFGWGALSALTENPGPDGSLARSVRAIAGVSAGAILGAHFTISGPDGLPAFRDRFLDQDVQSALRTTPTPENLLRAAKGGVNDRSGLPMWLKDNLLGSATLGDLDDLSRPRFIVHATDMQNRAPFLFDQRSFRAVCSERRSFPLTEAVAASAAVPVLFAPMVIRNFNGACATAPDQDRPTGQRTRLTGIDRHGLRSLQAYRSSASDGFIKLNDGGLVDNLGVGALMASANLADTASAPFAPRETDLAREVMFLVIDGSTRNGRAINTEEHGPGVITAMAASVDAMIDTASRRSLDTMERWMHEWRNRVIMERCARGLPKCRDLTVRLVRIALEDLTDQEDARRFADSTTALRMSRDDVTFFASKGRELLQQNVSFRAFARHAQRTP
jgi:NTE family protein